MAENWKAILLVSRERYFSARILQLISAIEMVVGKK